MNWIRISSPEFQRKWEIGAFVSDDAKPGMVVDGLPVRQRGDFDISPRFLLAVGAVATRRRLARELQGQGWQPCTWIHESARVAANVEIGEGSMVFPGDILAAGTRLGRFVLSNGSNVCGHDVEIGDYSVLLGRAWLGGDVRIGRDVLLGACAVVHPRKHVGDGATVGIGSVVIRSVAERTTVFGNPAKVIARSNP
ncbi:MAG: hypothetical protein JSS04_11370 [Proteobacteria bacterium]|nr:hypothetical protein [Pseudomonadota bacterium]